MTEDFFAIQERLRRTYLPQRQIAAAKVEPIGEGGFVAEIAGRTILTAPTKAFTTASELPDALAARWAAQQETGNDHFLWLQGRYVEAEKANRNGAFWSTKDLQFGEMSVKNGPINWVHNEQAVLGVITDNALIYPDREAAADRTQPVSEHPFEITDRDDLQHAIESFARAGNPELVKAFIMKRAHELNAEDMLPGDWKASPLNKASLLDPRTRPYMAATGAIWKWVSPEKAHAVQKFSDQGQAWWSMECIGREISCVSDDTHQGCGQSFDYITAMVQPSKTCEHIAGRTSARRIVDPCFLGGAIIVPPHQPGWGDADLETMRSTARLAEEAHSDAVGVSDSAWVNIVAQVAAYATRS